MYFFGRVGMGGINKSAWNPFNKNKHHLELILGVRFQFLPLSKHRFTLNRGGSLGTSIPKRQRTGEDRCVGALSDSWIRSLNSQRRMTLAFISEDVGNNQQQSAPDGSAANNEPHLWRESIKAWVALFYFSIFFALFFFFYSGLEQATFHPLDIFGR